jgi:hypothetical protein
MQASLTHPNFTARIPWLRAFTAAGAVLVLGSALRGGAAEATNPDPAPATAPPPAWVTPLAFNRSSMVPEPGQDHQWLLLDTQINASENETFHHLVRQMLTLSGVQDGATITLEFDPGYQTLTLHWAKIWRGNTSLDRLDRDKIKLIQPERDLEQYLYSGKRSAVLILEDVRVGDVIDFAYSIKGANPVFGVRSFAARIPVQLEEPVERLCTRILWPGQRRLYVKNHGCLLTPSVVKGEDAFEYRWDLRKVPGLHVQDTLPPWYEPQPWVQLSEQQSWAQVNEWALSLFPGSAPLSSRLQEKIQEWSRIVGREQQVLAALRFVQDEVRYFGIEMGANSHKPSDPSVVFERRFGDCKDKALLFVSVLRALGIEAWPALVNADLGRGIADWQPSTIAFDHVIAQAQLNGRIFWLDPTIRYQRGPLSAHYLPPYQRGLVVRPRTAALAEIPLATGLPRTITTEYFQLRGNTQPADLKVVTVCEGRDADALRDYFATTPRGDIENSYLREYTASYPGIKIARPVAFADDEQRNRIEMTEYYTIDKIWVRSDRDGSFRCEFLPAAMYALLKKPRDTVRTMPVGVRWPEQQLLRTEVLLPATWPAYTENKVIQDPAFWFRKNAQLLGNRLVMEYEYRSLNDSVATGRATDYFQRLDEASQSLGYALGR